MSAPIPNPNFTIANCTVADSPGLAENNVSAFWQDPNWVLIWPHTTLPLLIPEATKRWPRNLITSRISTRHQKAVAPDGKVVGYARWSLPPAKKQDDMWGMWKEAITPGVSEDEEREVRRVAESAVWEPGNQTEALDPEVNRIKMEILGRKEWMQLEYLAVHPSYSRQGIATALVASGMRAAEELGLDIFVLAFRMGLSVYERLGFKIDQVLIQDDKPYGGPGDWGVWYMTYEQGKDGKKAVLQEDKEKED